MKTPGSILVWGGGSTRMEASSLSLNCASWKMWQLEQRQKTTRFPDFTCSTWKTKPSDVYTTYNPLKLSSSFFNKMYWHTLLNVIKTNKKAIISENIFVKDYSYKYNEYISLIQPPPFMSLSKQPWFLLREMIRSELFLLQTILCNKLPVLWQNTCAPMGWINCPYSN